MQSYLPDLSKLLQVPKGVRQGRNVYEGYQRGWGLQHAELRQAVLADPLYQAAYAAAHDRTIMVEANRLNIFLIMRFYLDAISKGNIIEYGSYRGGTAIFMAFVARELFPDMKIFALDSFEGMPVTDQFVDAHGVGDFKDTSYAELCERVAELKLDNLILVKGFFSDTGQIVSESAGPLALAHIDCDNGPAVRLSYDAVRPLMVDGGYIVFDDATVSSCIGATEAVEDLVIRRDGMNSEQIWPHFVFRNFSHPTGSSSALA